MFACILAFLGMFSFVFGILMLLIIPGSMNFICFDLAPLPMLFMLVGFLLSLIVLFYIRNIVGSMASWIERKTLINTKNFTLHLGLFSSVLALAIQTYIRFKYGYGNFFLIGASGELGNLLYSESAIGTTDGILILTAVAVCFFIGLPWFITTFYASDFSEYVTITMVEFGGESFETKRSESYLPVGYFILFGALLTIPVILLAATPIAYLYPAPFAAVIFGKGDKKKIKFNAIVFAIIGLAIALVSTLGNAFPILSSIG